jgi:hypothetical protein
MLRATYGGIVAEPAVRHRMVLDPSSYRHML